MPRSWIPGQDGVPQPQNSIRDGYFVTTPAVAPDDGGKPANGANAFLEDASGARVGMWVNDISADFELAGSTAQGPTRRDFYPHNFSQPSIKIKGQTTNSYEYNRLAEFIRSTHRDALSVSSDGVIVSFVCLMPSSVKQPNRPVMRGRHRTVELTGFVKASKRGATRFVTAHEYELEFIVLAAKSFLGLEDDIIRPYQTLKTIGQRLESGRVRVKKLAPGTNPGSSLDKPTAAKPQDVPPTPIVAVPLPAGPFADPLLPDGSQPFGAP